MNIIRDAATLLILALLVISVRVTPLDQIGDLVPSTEAAEAAALPKAAEKAAETAVEDAAVESESVMIFSIGANVEIDVDPNSEADADCPVRARTLRCTTAADGSSRCELELQQVKNLVLPPAGPETARLVTHTCT